jgi:dTDP-4-amino-4,6-dideoxygalactose transaminase
VYLAAVQETQHPVRRLLAGVDAGVAGLSARIHPVGAILGVRALHDLDDRLAARRASAVERLSAAAKCGGVHIFCESPEIRFSWSAVPAVLESGAARDLRGHGIEPVPMGLSYVPELGGAETVDAPRARRLVSRVFHLADRPAPPAR